MFGIDFSELMVILVIALIVIGPERLPKVARTLGHLWGRAQRYVNSVKSDIARDMAVEEFRQLQQKVQQEADNAQRAVKQATQAVDQQMRQLNEGMKQPAQAIASAIAQPPAPMPQAPASEQTQLELQPPPEQKKLSVD